MKNKAERYKGKASGEKRTSSSDAQSVVLPILVSISCISVSCERLSSSRKIKSLKMTLTKGRKRSDSLCTHRQTDTQTQRGSQYLSNHAAAHKKVQRMHKQITPKEQ